MLFFVVCACFALFPEQVLYGAQNGLALCLNAVIPSLLPFMLVSACIIKSNFSRPLGAVLSKVLTPLTKMSPTGCVCFVTGILGGYGAGARAVCESYKQGQVSKEEAQKLLAFCNNAGPLFIMGTIGISFFSSKSVGVMLFMIQILTALICASVFGESFRGEKRTIKEEWIFYKKNKPSMGGLITKAAVESGSAIVTACVFVITFSAIIEVLPFGQYSLLAGLVEVTRGSAEMSRLGYDALPIISAFAAWGGLSVHFQANALSEGKFSMKTYYIGKIAASIIAYIITKLCFADIYVFMVALIGVAAVLLVTGTVKLLLFPKSAQPRGFHRQRRS